MNVNQHTPMASPYGQPQPGYGQPSYAPLDGGYTAPYAPYNGPASAYQPGAPPQGIVPAPVSVTPYRNPFYTACSRWEYFAIITPFCLSKNTQRRNWGGQNVPLLSS